MLTEVPESTTGWAQATYWWLEVRYLYDKSSFTTKRELFVVQIKLRSKRAPS